MSFWDRYQFRMTHCVESFSLFCRTCCLPVQSANLHIDDTLELQDLMFAALEHERIHHGEYKSAKGSSQESLPFIEELAEKSGQDA